MYNNNKKNCLIFLSVLLIVFGLLIIFIEPFLFNCVLSLQCNKILYNLWKNVPKNVETKVYLFNWTNPYDINNLSTKLKFEEIGPFVYQQQEKKVNLVWNDNGTITYQQEKFWYYDTSRENGNLELNITNVHTQLVTLSYLTRFWNYFIRKSAFIALSGLFTELPQTHTVRELLFDGYDIPLMSIARNMPFFKLFNLPSWDKFGWIYARNGSSEFDGTFNIGSGSNSVIGEVYNWNYQNKTNFYNNQCNKISGSTGQLFPKKLSKESIRIFSTDIKRSVLLKFDKEQEVFGVIGYKYVASNYMFDNGSINPENKCFCVGECIPSGLVNISLALHNAPVFASLPHFYGADPYYNNLIDGLKPKKEKHDSYIIIEPITGIVLKVYAKLQINLLMQPISGISLLENVPKVYVPVIWLTQKVGISSTEALFLKIFLGFSATNTAFGCVFIMIGIILFLFIYRYFQKIILKFS